MVSASSKNLSQFVGFAEFGEFDGCGGCGGCGLDILGNARVLDNVGGLERLEKAKKSFKTSYLSRWTAAATINDGMTVIVANCHRWDASPLSGALREQLGARTNDSD